MKLKYIAWRRDQNPRERSAQVQHVIDLPDQASNISSLLRMVVRAAADTPVGTAQLIHSSDNLYIVQGQDLGTMIISDQHPLHSVFDHAKLSKRFANAAVEYILDWVEDEDLEGSILIPIESSPLRVCTNWSGTSFHGDEINRTYNDLELVLGEPHIINGDKSHCEWGFTGTDEAGDFVFTLYDYKEYYDPRSTDISFDWHIGARTVQDSKRALALLKQML